MFQTCDLKAFGSSISYPLRLHLQMLRKKRVEMDIYQDFSDIMVRMLQCRVGNDLNLWGMVIGIF